MISEIARRVASSMATQQEQLIIKHFPTFMQSLIDCMLSIDECPRHYKLLLSEDSREYQSVVLVSGGLDSTIAYFLKSQQVGEENVLPLFVNLGEAQPYFPKEVKALDALGIPYVLVHEPLLTETWDHIIPARNLVLLAAASEFVMDGGEICISSVSGETPEYGGDKSLRFYELVHQAIKHYDAKDIKIVNSASRTKTGWVKYFLGLTTSEIERCKRVELLKKTVSCFSADSGHCGECRACFRRWITFENSGIDTSNVFTVHPYTGGKQLVEESKQNMTMALQNQDFSYYSEDRCKETLNIIYAYERQL